MDDRTAKLLLKGVRSLPQKEQDLLLTALVHEAFREPSRGIGSPPASEFVFRYGNVPVPAPTMGAPGQSTMLPVRLPPKLHERLRRWSAEHGFSMAGVVRGLVERFLDEQSGKVVPRNRPAARPRTKRSPTARG